MPVVIVTSSSSGIGRGIALLFAERKWKVSLCGRNEAALREVACQCKEKGAPDVTYAIGDVTDDKTLEAIVKNTVDKLGAIDSLINNAGIGEYGPVLSTSADVYDKLSKTNIRSVIVLSQLALPHLINSRGCIVNVGSALSSNPVPNTAFYAMTKAAIDHFTRVLAVEVGPKGVRVNGVCPAITVTEFQKRAGMPEDHYQKYIEAASAVYPLGRVGLPEDIAKAAFFLASSEAGFTTGQMLKVDDGFEVTRPKVPKDQRSKIEDQ